MSETFNPSRRTLMKGAAWAVPAVAVASAAPALAASPIVSCQPADTLGFGTQNADVISWTRVVGTDKATAGGLGSAFDMRLGTWQTAQTQVVDNSGNTVKVTGYKMNFASDGVVLRTVKKVQTGGAKFLTPAQWTMGRKDAAGHDTWSGRLTVRPNSGPLVIGGGLVYTGTLQTNMQ
ncbi:MAG: hypothetical protein Q4B12_00985 [Bowdeniella nasicola]|nr:hypothetical protein [Bowdeniella nasicola]